MGKSTGFMEYERQTSKEVPPLERIKNFNEFHEPLSMEEQRKQAARCMDCGVPFCQYGKMIAGMASGCPLNNLVPEWNDNVYTGNMEMAYKRLSKTNNFPEFTSRVCPALCEAACTCNINGDPVCTKENERSIIENAYEKGYVNCEPPKVRSGKRVAIVGSGPSGLAAADQLNRRGHQVTVFERSDRLGGLLMYGIPNMKLEKQIIDRKIDCLKKTGIEFVTGTEIANGKNNQNPAVAKGDEMAGYLTDAKVKNVKAEKLLEEYDAVVLACGASNPRDIKVTGRDAKGIYFAVDFLKTTTRSLLNSNFADGKYLLMGTKRGFIKKTPLNEFDSNRKNGLLSITLREDDELIDVRLTDGQDNVVLVTEQGSCITFSEKDVRPMGRTAQGVIGIRLDEDDCVIGMESIIEGNKNATLLAITENGFGKRTELEEYRVQTRGGKGVITYKITPKTGKLVGIRIATDDEDVMLITDNGTIIRLKVKDISVLGRSTQGVTLMRTNEGKVVSIETIRPEENGEE